MEMNGEYIEKWRKALEDLILVQQDDGIQNNQKNGTKIRPYSPKKQEEQEDTSNQNSKR